MLDASYFHYVAGFRADATPASPADAADSPITLRRYCADIAILRFRLFFASFSFHLFSLITGFRLFADYFRRRDTPPFSFSRISERRHAS